MDQQEEGQLLREHLFEGDLVPLPRPDEGIPGFLPDWYDGPLPALVYPPLEERGAAEDGNINLEITPYHIYYGALRELAETADEDRATVLQRLVTEWNPNAALEVCELARIHIERDLETALLHYELAQELDETLYEAVQDAGMCEYALAGAEEEEREERLSNAEELFRRAVELRPEAGLSWWSLARVLHDLGAEGEAAACLQEFLNTYPEGEQRDMVEHALQFGFEADQQEQDHAQHAAQQTFLQAQSLVGQDPAQAVALLQPLAETYPDAGEIWFVLGTAHRRAGDLAEAERCLRRAARLAPAEPFIWWELGRACIEMQEWRSAEEALRKAVELDPENPLHLSDLGRVRLAVGDRGEAEELIRRAEKMVPEDPEIQAAVAELEGR